MAQVPVPDGTQMAYNNYVFGPYTRTNVTFNPIISGDQRVFKWTQIDLQVSGWLTQYDSDMVNALPGGTLDAAMQNIRRKISAAGKNLVYVNKGAGADLNINQPNGEGVRDTNNGPVPGKFKWWPVGGAPDGCHGAGFTWSITACIPECLHALYSPGRTGNFNELYFSVAFDTDHRGLVTITTRGLARIPQSLREGNILLTNIDQYIDNAIRPIPVGFFRTISKEISTDRSSCTFTVTDVQREVPFPPGITDMTMYHDVRQIEPNDRKWDCTISGTVTLDPTQPKILGWQWFMTIALARILRGQNPTVRSVVPTPPRVHIRENLFKNSADFTLTYQLIGCDMSNIIFQSGLWTPVVNNPLVPQENRFDATRWARSMVGTVQMPDGTTLGRAQNTRGILGMGFNPASEVIIDVCSQASAGTGGGGGGSWGEGEIDEDGGGGGDDWGGGGAPEPVALVTGDNDVFNSTANNGVVAGPVDDGVSDYGQNLFDPDFSWVTWECDVERYTNHHIVRHKPLAGVVRMRTPEVDPLGAVEDVEADTSDPTPIWSATVPDIIQQISAPSMTIRLRGMAIRVAWRPSAPYLVSYGGVQPVLKSERVSESVLAAGGGVVYFRTSWDLLYVLPTAPSTLPLPANPYAGTDGSEAE